MIRVIGYDQYRALVAILFNVGIHPDNSHLTHTSLELLQTEIGVGYMYYYLNQNAFAYRQAKTKSKATVIEFGELIVKLAPKYDI
jgi:hypothetical protein